MTTTALDRHLIAADFEKNMQGKLTDAQVTEGLRLIRAETTGAFAGAFATYLFGFTLTAQGAGYNFTGAGGGLFFPPGPFPFVGALSTADMNALVTNTQAILVVSAAVYFNVTFFDVNHNPLGVLNAGGGGALGTGGGKGAWSAT